MRSYPFRTVKMVGELLVSQFFTQINLVAVVVVVDFVVAEVDGDTCVCMRMRMRMCGRSRYVDADRGHCTQSN